MNALAFNDPYKPGAALARSLRSGQATVNHLDAGIHRGRPSRLLCHHPTGSLQPASPGSAHPGEVERWLPVSQQLALDSAKVDRVVGNPDREPELRFHPRGQARVTRLGERIVGKMARPGGASRHRGQPQAGTEQRRKRSAQRRGAGHPSAEVLVDIAAGQASFCLAHIQRAAVGGAPQSELLPGRGPTVNRVQARAGRYARPGDRQRRTRPGECLSCLAT